jgi:hypothetical protein
MSSTPTSDAAGVGDTGWQAAVGYVLGQLCLPQEVVVSLPPAGTLRLRPKLVERRWCAVCADGSGAQGDAILLHCAGQPALLLVEPRTACGLVNAVLGLAQPLLAGPLSRIERGVLEGTVAAILAKLGRVLAIGMRGGVPDSWPPGAFALEIAVGLRGEMGCAWLVASDLAWERLWKMREPGGDETAPWLEVAHTRVPAHELAQAEVGDTIVFDETAARSPEAAWPARVLWQGRALAAWWSAAGEVSLAEDSAPEAETQAEARRAGEPHQAAGGEVPWVEASAGVDIVAWELSARAPLVVSRGQPVGVRVGDRYFAQGEVTQHEGAFAMVITRKASG